MTARSPAYAPSTPPGTPTRPGVPAPTRESGEQAIGRVFVARQPIFDKRKRVHAYELLFRRGFENAAGQIDRSVAAGEVLSRAILAFGLESLTGSKKAFLNFTAENVLSGAAQLVPRETGVIELLEGQAPTPELVGAMRLLQKQGYKLALDDFSYDPSLEPLIELAHYVKVSFRDSDAAMRDSLAKRLLPRGVMLLAEQVETREEYDEAVRLGYTYFQGYFFCRPEVMAKREIKATRLTSLRLLECIHRASLDYTMMEDIIKRDVALSHKLLRYLNSPWFAFRARIDSIRHGLVLLGERDVRRWVTLMALGGLGDTKPQELVVQSAVRARLCESLAPACGLVGHEFGLFLTGAFSLLEAMLDRPLAEALREVPLPSDVELALQNEPDNELRAVLDLVVAYEQGRWSDITTLAEAIGMNEEVVPPLFIDAVKWTRETFG
ncbi:MAG: HDOD domain-containing protein [Vicinamibacterales bacterium]